MVEIEVTAKQWGSSIGIILPKKIVEKEHIKSNDKITIEIKKGIMGKDIWGLFKNEKIDSQKAKNEMRKGWE